MKNNSVYQSKLLEIVAEQYKSFKYSLNYILLGAVIYIIFLLLIYYKHDFSGSRREFVMELLVWVYLVFSPFYLVYFWLWIKPKKIKEFLNFGKFLLQRREEVVKVNHSEMSINNSKIDSYEFVITESEKYKCYVNQENIEIVRYEIFKLFPHLQTIITNTNLSKYKKN